MSDTTLQHTRCVQAGNRIKQQEAEIDRLTSIIERAKIALIETGTCLDELEEASLTDKALTKHRREK